MADNPTEGKESSLDVSKLSLNDDTTRQHPTAGFVSDTGPQRLNLRIPSSPSTGSTSPLSQNQGARSTGVGPPSSGSSGSLAGVSKLPAGMQAKMMAVLPSPELTEIVPCFEIFTVLVAGAKRLWFPTRHIPAYKTCRRSKDSYAGHVWPCRWRRSIRYTTSVAVTSNKWVEPACGIGHEIR